MPTSARNLARRSAPFLAALLFGLLAAAPLLANSGFLLTRGGGDSPFLLQRLHELLSALNSGQFPARWMPGADFGYGYPFFNYYAALPYYLAAALKLYGFSYVTALKLTQTGALLAAAAGVYGWARALPRPLSRPQALLASAAYTFAPFHLVNLYVRGDSLSELWAMALYPLVLWAAQRCLDRVSFGRVFALAGAVGLLVLTHNISALNFMPFVGLYLVLGGVAAGRGARLAPTPGPSPVEKHYRGGVPQQQAARRAMAGPWRPLGLAALGLAWGLALCGFFWVPALLEIDAVQIADVTQGYFFYGNHFRSADLVQGSLFFSLDTAGGAPSPFAMSLAQALATVGGLIVMVLAAFRARRWTAADSFMVLGLVMTTFMMTPASEWLWANAPLLRFSQFPWRFLSIQALFASLIIARLVPEPRATGRGLRWALAIGLGVALAVTTLGRLRPEFVPLADTDVTTQRLALMEYFSGNIGSTIGFEYLPRGVAARPFTSDSLLERMPELLTLSGSATGARLSATGSQQEWDVDAGQGSATVALPTHYWPGWTAYVDGKRTSTGPAAGLGWISFDVPAGSHSVRLRLERTPVRAFAEALSVVALLVPWAFAVYLWNRRRRQPTAKPARSEPPPVAHEPSAMRGPGLPIVAAFGLLGLAAGASIILRVAKEVPSSLPLSIDFDQLTYLHRDAVRFDDGTRLVGLNYATDHVARGETLTIQSAWQPASAGEARLSLAPASNLLSQAPVSLSTVTLSMDTAVSVTSVLDIPRDIPPGVYFVTVQWADASGPRTALTPGGRPRGLVHVAPVWVDDPGPPAPTGAPLASFGPTVDLLSAATAATVPGVFEVNLAWHALAQIPGTLQLGLRLRDAAGAEWAGSDTQLAYGYYPTPLWREGEVIPDFYRLRLPAGAPPASYQLDLNLYDAFTRASLGSVVLPVRLDSATPRGERQPGFALTPALALAEVEIAPRFNQGDAPELRAGWLTTAVPGAGWRARWTLIAVDGTRTEQVLDLAPGSTTADWPAEAYILGRVRLGTVPTLPPGPYALAVQLIDAMDQAVGEEVTVAQVEVLALARNFDLPAVSTLSGAVFGDVIELYGYDLAQPAAELRLTLVWRALATPGHDYKFFVHLFNPVDGFVVSQFDAMPRDFTYPTALWVKDEVVSDTIDLPLAGAAPGEYRLAIGWYDPLHPEQRLPAHDANGQPLPNDQWVLPSPVRVP